VLPVCLSRRALDAAQTLRRRCADAAQERFTRPMRATASMRGVMAAAIRCGGGDPERATDGRRLARRHWLPPRTTSEQWAHALELAWTARSSTLNASFRLIKSEKANHRLVQCC